LVELRALYEQAVRRSPYLPEAYRLVEVPPVARLVGPSPHFLDNGVTWTDLDGHDADAVIAREVAFFQAEGRDVQWNVYDDDAPQDLEQRLVAAGFERGPAETLMGAAIDGLAKAGAAPRHDIRRVTTHDEFEVYLAIGTAVWGPDLEAWHRNVLRERLAPDDPTTLFVAYDGDEGVGCANVVVAPGGPVGHLFGGTVLPTHRRQGIYRALLAARAVRAAQQGAAILMTDANDNSRPVLEGVGFVAFGRRLELVRRAT
jgi:GNAT superfamily N-acetyltransferase